jgi:hypothetical protein
MLPEINKTKVLGELFLYLVLLNDQENKPTWRRLSPATKEVHNMLKEALRACQEAVRNGHPLMFEINVWEQQSLSGWAIDLKNDESPIEVE